MDILTPIADDSFTFGEIAAAHSLSDLYLMGAKPITALNIIGFLAKLDLNYLEKIIQGGSEKIKQAGANACTDIIEFELLGHALQLAQASKVSLRIDVKEVPIFEEAIEYAEMFLFPGGSIKNEKFVRPHLSVDESVQDNLYRLLCDAQTSGGLLISVEESKGERLIKTLRDRGLNGVKVIDEAIIAQKKSLYIF